MRILELYAGIGGVAAAVAGAADVVAAVDQDASAHAVYRAWFDHPAHRWNLAGVPTARLEALQADLWWMSPPCQPFTVRGRQRDLDDPRCSSFVYVMDHLAVVRPARVALENVPGFAGSRAHARLRGILRGAGYRVHEAEWCPTLLGWPNRRRRFYLVATRLDEPLPATRPEVAAPLRPLRPFLDADAPSSLDVPRPLRDRYGTALNVVDADDPQAIAECFTSAYGRSPVYAGSYLRDGPRLRRFSTTEILRLLGFPARCVWPDTVPPRHRGKLAGNSLSVPVVRALLGPWLSGPPDCRASTTGP